MQLLENGLGSEPRTKLAGLMSRWTKTLAVHKLDVVQRLDCDHAAGNC